MDSSTKYTTNDAVRDQGESKSLARTNPYSFDRRGSLEVAEGSIRRQLVPELYETYLELKENGGLTKLNEAGMIRTLDADSDSPNIVVHDFLPFVTYPQEWTLEMLKQAALTILDVSICLNEHGLSLQDPHPWNVTFFHGRPVYYDFSSVFEGRSLHQRFWNDFYKGCYIALWAGSRKMGAKHYAKIASALMNAEHEWRMWRQPRAEWRRIFDKNLLGRMCRRFWSLEKRYRDEPGRQLRAIREHVRELELLAQPSVADDSHVTTSDHSDPLSHNERALAKLLDSIVPGRLLELGCGDGWFCGYASRKGHTVLGLDVDPNAIDSARGRAMNDGFDVGSMNVVWPTPPQGAFSMYPSATDRFRVDTVMMVDVHHHLNLLQNITFEALSAAAAGYGASNLIVEWVSNDDPEIKRWIESGRLKSIPEWYREADFVAAFTKHFPNVSTERSSEVSDNSSGSAGRTMFLFQR